MKKLIVIATLALSPVFSAQEMVTKPVQSFQTAQYQAKKKAFIDNLLSKMTLDEKIGQLNLPTSGDFTTGCSESRCRKKPTENSFDLRNGCHPRLRNYVPDSIGTGRFLGYESGTAVCKSSRKRSFFRRDQLDLLSNGGYFPRTKMGKGI